MNPTSAKHRQESIDAKGVAILARSLFRQMREQGYTPEQIVGLSTELIQLVREDMQRDLEAAE